jgi:hypothetical protein
VHGRQCGGGSVVAGVNATADAIASGPVYVFATPVLGGQATLGIFGVGGYVGVDIDATLTGPRGATISGHAHDSRTTFSDVFWQGSLKWNNASTTRWSTRRETSRAGP